MSKHPRSRRTVLQALGVVGSGALGLGALTSASRGSGETESDSATTDPSGWGSYQFDPANTGYNPGGAGLADPMYSWRTGLDRDASGPVVGSECVFTVQSGATVTALDRDTGAVSWAETVDGEVDRNRDETALALANGTLVAALGNCVYAFDATDGTVQWSHHLDAELSTPTVADGTVFLAMANGAFLAFDVETGDEQWRFADDVASISMANDSRKAPAVAPDGSAVYVTDGEFLYSLDPAAGTERWRVAASPYAAPVAADAVYVTAHDAVRAFSPADGTLVWERTFDENVDTAPVLADGRLFVQHYPRGVRALDAGTGETLWTVDLAIADRRSTLVADGDHLYVPLQSVVENGAGVLDEVAALDPADGSERWRFSRRYIDTVGSEPVRTVSAGDALYAVVDDDDVYRIDERPDGVRWRAEVGDEPDRVAVAGDGVVYAASTSGDDGALAALEPATGATRWEISDDDLVGRPVANDEYCFHASFSLLARDPSDGSVAWRASTPGEARTGLCLHDGTLYFGWGDGGGAIYAVDAADGSEQWAVGAGRCAPSIDVGGATPAVAGDVVVAEVDDGLHGYDAADGSERWSVDQRVYALAGGSDHAVASWRNAVRAVDQEGTTVWTRDLSNNVTGLEVIADAGSDGVVVARTVGSPASHYRALSLADGSPLWEFSADEGPISMPTISDGTAYAATAGGRLHGFDPETGELRQSYDAYHGLHDRPAVVDGTVAAPSDEGFVYGFETL